MHINIIKFFVLNKYHLSYITFNPEIYFYLNNCTIYCTINLGEIMDKTIGISDLRKSISAKIKEVHEDRLRYIIMQRSKAKAVLISPEEIETLEIMADKEILDEIKQAKSDILKGQVKTYEDFFGEELPEKSKK